MKIFSYMILLATLSCTTTYPKQDPIGEPFPNVEGQSLSGKKWNLPKEIKGQKTLLLIGYKQKSQFDIDRWLIGIDQKRYKVNVFEIPAVQGIIPRIIANSIDSGMRSGIPKPLWSVVITVYRDADKIAQFLGNETLINARVVVVDEQGIVAFSYDKGFSVNALNQLGEFFPTTEQK